MTIRTESEWSNVSRPRERTFSKALYPWLLQRVVLPLAEPVLGTSVLSNLAFLQKSCWWSAEQLSEYQDQRLRELVLHAYTGTVYYRTLFDKLGISPNDIKRAKDLSALPLLTKDIIKAKEHELIATTHAGRAQARFTSGSSGNPTRFWQTPADYSWQWAAHFRAWGIAGYELGDRYVKISINADRGLKRKRLQDLFMNSLYICAFKMDPGHVSKFIAQIISFKPKVVYGYSSSINVMAREMLKQGVCYPAQAVITTGDNLILSFRKDIETAFQAKVYDDYGCGGEGLAIANQCEYGTYHVNDELLVVEEVNNEAVVTSLNNLAMPLLRYVVGDRIGLRKSTRCKCGRGLTTINSLDGRSHDVVRTIRGDVLVVHFFTILFEYMQGIDQFKIIQRRLEEIVVRLVINDRFDKHADEKRIVEYIRKSVGDSIAIKIEYVAAIPLEHNGKHRLIEGMRPNA